ncbi:hypothetical protein BDQ12DRAFT_770940 [Crucibulum laeve]|uniref:Fungal-specific transcription factor domain-containing protein n=1 Tax=Crucibulum laeve TaxID=68775 RepID=A0A5C3M7M0_9AGAR|nr:hypothetical protein BDQ12DRAFT_770940 [Crucibulum laeve]
MSFPIFQSQLLGALPVYITYPGILKIFPDLSSSDQRLTIQRLEAFVEQILFDGSTAHLIRLGVVDPINKRELNIVNKEYVLEKCYWQLIHLYRLSTPSRISDAIRPLSLLIELYNSLPQRQPLSREHTVQVALLHLTVALSKVPGEERNALRTFKASFSRMNNLHEDYLPIQWMVYARAHMTMLLRRLNRVQEAEDEEQFIRDWIQIHAELMSPTEYKAAVTDEICGKDSIFNSPDMHEHYDNGNSNSNSNVIENQASAGSTAYPQSLMT